MADAAPAPAPAKSSAGPSFFQRKMAGLPVWGWAAIIGGGVLAYWLYTKYEASQSASSTSSTTGTTSSAAPTSGFGVGGYGGAAPTVYGSSGSSSTSSSPTTTTLPFQVQSGSGWWQPPSSASAAQAEANGGPGYQSPITDANGNTYEWVDGSEYGSLQAAGEQIYYEPLPGVFLPAPIGSPNLAPGTPLYVQIPSGTGGNPAPPANTAGNASTAASSTTAPAVAAA